VDSICAGKLLRQGRIQVKAPSDEADLLEPPQGLA
jgi:hypothetical protein